MIFLMNKVGIYPGTFDPITYGHIDVIKRALKIVNKLVIAVAKDTNKDYFFSSDERVELIKKSLFKDIKLKKTKIQILSFDTLTMNLCKKHKAANVRLNFGVEAEALLHRAAACFTEDQLAQVIRDVEQHQKDHHAHPIIEERLSGNLRFEALGNLGCFEDPQHGDRIGGRN